MDKTKKSNFKCENCDHWKKEKDGFIFVTYCKLTDKSKKFNNTCKNFTWIKT